MTPNNNIDTFLVLLRGAFSFSASDGGVIAHRSTNMPAVQGYAVCVPSDVEEA